MSLELCLPCFSFMCRIVRCVEITYYHTGLEPKPIRTVSAYFYLKSGRHLLASELSGLKPV